MQLKTGGYYPPVFYENILVFSWTVGGLAAARSRSRSRNALRCFSLRSRRYATPVPTEFGGFLKLMPVGEDIILPHITIPPSFSCENATSLYTREAFFWFSFYYWVSFFLIVGDDILGVPFIKISLCLARVVEGASPTDLCDVCCFVHGRFVNRPYGFGCHP